MGNDTKNLPPSADTLHTCSYACERPGCIRAQRDYLAARLAAEGEEILVNTPYDVYTLPLQPSGLSSGPRFVVHVPGPEAQEDIDQGGGEAAPTSAPVGATLSNPWTGKPRDYRDVDSDPEGVLCVEPGAPLKAAPPSAPVGVVDIEVLKRLEEAYDFGQFSDDFNYPLARPIRKDIRSLLRSLTAAQQQWHFDRKRFERAPCYLCGYNGPGYYQPDTHPCAAKYHAAQHKEPTI